MAENPIQGNEGASRQRLEELKQINLEGAKAKSTLEGLSSVFKNLGRSANSLSTQQQEFAKKAIESSNLLAGQVDNFNKSYVKNIDLAKNLQGFTVNQLKNAAERRKFEKQTLAAQGEQAQIQASIKELTDQKLDLEAQFEDISQQAAVAAQNEKDAIEAAAAAKQKQLDVAKLVEAENKAASDSAFESSKRIQDYGKEIEASQARRNKLAQDKAALATEEGKAAFEEAQGRKFTAEEIQKVIAAQQQSLNEEYNLQKALQKKIAIEGENIDLQRNIQKEGEKTLKNQETKVENAERELNKAKEIHKALGEQTEELNAQIETTDLIKKNHEQAAVEIDKGLDNAEKLQKKIEEVDKAGGKLLESFQNLGDALLSNVPIIGQAFNAIFGQLGKASQMFRDATAQGTSKLGAMFKATQGFITGLTVVGIGGFMSALFDGMKTASEFGKIVRQGLGGGMIDASKSMAAASAAASRLTIPLAEAGAMVGQLNDALGTSLGFNADQLTTFGTLTKKIGVSADAAAHLFEQSVKLGIPYKDLTADIVGATEKLNAMNGTAIAPKAVLEEMGHASQTILRNMKENPDALIKAAAGARALGMSMDDIANAAESTLDFESSMQKEMEAELMLGKELNLDRLRAAAASGDVNAQQAEMKRLVLENKDALKGNVLAQQMFADTIGLSKEELNKMMNEEEKQRKLGKQDAARQAANDRMKKMSQKEIGFQTMESMKSIASLADRIDKFIESFQQGVVDFGKAFMKAIEPLSSTVGDIFNADTMAERWKIVKARLWPAIKESFGNLGTLVMGSLGEGFGGIADIFKDKDKSLLSNGGILGKLLGGLVVGGAGLSIAFKGLSALGGIFGKMRGTPMLPMHVVLSKGLGGLARRLGGGITKGLSKLLGGKKTMAGKAVRGMAAKIKRPGLAKGLGAKAAKTGSKILGKSAGLASKAAVKTGAKIAARVGANALKAIPVVGQVAMIGMAAYDAFQGVKKAGEFFGKDQKDATGGEKTAAALGSAVSGLTFGLLDAGKAARGIKAAGDFVAEKAKAGWEGIKKGASAFGGWVSSGWDSLKQGFSNVKDKATEIANTAKEKVGDFANAVKDKAVAAKNAIMDFAGGVKDKAKAFAGAVGEKVGAIKDKVRDFLDANDGLVGGIKAAASGLASKASEWLGSKVKGLKDWWNNDTSKKAKPEVEPEKITTPLVQMSASQTKELTKAFNTALAKGAEATTKAVGQFADVIEVEMNKLTINAEDQILNLKRLKEEGDRQHQKEIMELRNQTAALYQLATSKQVIKMDSYKVGESLVSRY